LQARAEGADLGDAGAVEGPAGAHRAGVLGVVDQALAVDDEAGVQAADAPDAADHLGAHVGHDLPEQALVAQARDHLVGVVGLAVVGRQDARAARAGCSWRLDAAGAAAVEVGAELLGRRATSRRRHASSVSSSGTRTSAQPDWWTWTSGPPMSSDVIFWLLAPLMSAAPAMTM
jgi:hypothetical protein